MWLDSTELTNSCVQMVLNAIHHWMFKSYLYDLKRNAQFWFMMKNMTICLSCYWKKIKHKAWNWSWGSTLKGAYTLWPTNFHILRGDKCSICSPETCWDKQQRAWLFPQNSCSISKFLQCLLNGWSSGPTVTDCCWPGRSSEVLLGKQWHRHPFNSLKSLCLLHWCVYLF